MALSSKWFLLRSKEVGLIVQTVDRLEDIDIYDIFNLNLSLETPFPETKGGDSQSTGTTVVTSKASARVALNMPPRDEKARFARYVVKVSGKFRSQTCVYRSQKVYHRANSVNAR
jgi:hypothetical protein